MLHRSQNHASLIDLSSQTITSIDFQKKSYSVVTFEEMKQYLEQMQQRMKRGDNQAQMNFQVDANSTGKTKPVGGFDCREMILKMTMEGTDEKTGQKGSMVITTDMWIASGVPGYQEVRDFYRRMAEKLAWTPGGNMFMANPDAAKGMAEVYKEVSKLDGVPMQQFISMGGAGTAPASGDTAQSQPQPQAQPERPSIGGILGRRIGLPGKKSSPAEAPPPQQGSGGSGSPGSLLEMTTELANFSSAAVDDAQFAIPSGFKKVDSEFKRGR